MKTLNILLSLGIIAEGVINYYNGGHPNWFTFFLGWGLLLWHEIQE